MSTDFICPAKNNTFISVTSENTSSGGGTVTVDSALSTTSTNPVQNKVITGSINLLSTKLNGIETGAQVNTIEHITLNGSACSIDSSTKTATGTIVTCSPFPDGTIKNGTTLQLCDSLIETGEAKVGMMFMETITLTDSPSGGRAEVLVRVMGTGAGDEVLYLEMHSTNTNERNWYTMWYNGAMEWGDTTCPWFASLLIPKATYDSTHRCGDPLSSTYIAASQQYVNDKVSSVDHTKIINGSCQVTADGVVSRPTSWQYLSFTKDDTKVTFEGDDTTPAPYYDWDERKWVLAHAGKFSVTYNDGTYSIAGVNCAKVYSTEGPYVDTINFILDKDTGTGTVVIGTAQVMETAQTSSYFPVLPSGYASSIPEGSLLQMGPNGQLILAVNGLTAVTGQVVIKTDSGWGTASMLTQQVVSDMIASAIAEI